MRTWLEETKEKMGSADKRDLLQALGIRVTVLNKKHAKIEYDIGSIGSGASIAYCQARISGEYPGEPPYRCRAPCR